MKLLLGIVTLLLLNACSLDDSEQSIADTEENDPCNTAIIFQNAQISEEMVDANYTGELNNYWGEDTSKLDFKHRFEDGKLVESIFYYENGEINEKYSFKCQSLHGKIEFYHENGQLGKVIPYKYGRRDGVGIQYDSLGSEISRVTFKNDSLMENSN